MQANSSIHCLKQINRISLRRPIQSTGRQHIQITTGNTHANEAAPRKREPKHAQEQQKQNKLVPSVCITAVRFLRKADGGPAEEAGRNRCIQRSKRHRHNERPVMLGTSSYRQLQAHQYANDSIQITPLWPPRLKHHPVAFSIFPSHKSNEIVYENTDTCLPVIV